jgi:hypothetical protein
MLRWTVICFVLLLPLRGFGQGHDCAQSPREAPRVWDSSRAGMKLPTDVVQEYHPNPALWERQVQDAFEPKGVAKIVTVADRLALETYCAGIHTIYIHDSPNLDLHDYVGKFVRVRYHYSTVLRHDIRCVRAPCGPIEETGIVIESIVDTAVSEEEQARYTTSCPEVP